jgi:hypothetical protein
MARSLQGIQLHWPVNSYTSFQGKSNLLHFLYCSSHGLSSGAVISTIPGFRLTEKTPKMQPLP